MPYPSTTLYPGATTFPAAAVSGVFTDANPCPRVLVQFSELVAGTVRVTVRRTAAGRTFDVRGGINLYAVGGVSILDLEAPFGIPVSYQAEQFDTNGLSLGFTTAQTVQLDVTDTWVTQPLSPVLAVSPLVFLNSAATQSRPSPGATVWTEGATVGRFIGGQRTGLQQTTLTFRMRTSADADEFDSMFGGYTTDFPSVLCIRTPPKVPLPPVLFAACPAPQRVQYGVGALITYDLTVDEVAPPAPGLVIPILRRKDIDAAYATRAARAAAYTTRLARDSDYSLAGLAG
jgi:hypothetical protein